MTREQMQDRMIKTFGHEDTRTIMFAEMCESHPDNKWQNAKLQELMESIIYLKKFENRG